MKTLATLDKPLIAAVDGPALGIGTTMLFMCDYVVASEWSQFGVDNVSVGLPLDAAATLLGPRMIGHHVAFELLVMGEAMDAIRAREVGLVNRIVAAELVEETARQAALTIADLPPEAVRLAKRMMVGDRRDVVTRITSEASSFAALQRSPHASSAAARPHPAQRLQVERVTTLIFEHPIFAEHEVPSGHVERRSGSRSSAAVSPIHPSAH